ncbi:hypothetical protein ScPMuIL_016618 [Solemya velum]
MDPKLSRLAFFDDLVRNGRILTAGIEPEFKKFVLNQDAFRQKWCEAEILLQNLQEKVRLLDTENGALQTRLKHARNQIEQEMQKRTRVEHDREQLERQIALVRELLRSLNESPPRNLTTINELSGSILSDIDYDKTDDDFDNSFLRSGRKWKRPSAPPMEDEYISRTSPKRRKSDEDEMKNSFVTTATVTVSREGTPVDASVAISMPTTKKLNKSFSEPALDNIVAAHRRDIDSDPESDESVWATPGNRNSNAKRPSRGILKRNPYPETPKLRKASSAGKGLNRVHIFISRTAFKPETCVPCGKRVKFGRLAMKCKDCRATCHPECKDNLPLPCVPNAPSTPGTGKQVGMFIADYVNPEIVPMIPALVVHCCNEIQARGFNEVGLYRVPGSATAIKELKEKFFKGKGMPNLSNIDDIHVLCGCVKEFLRQLQEPLITYALWHDFVKSAESPDRAMGQAEMYQAISQLPQPNRDTLAFLIYHLQQVAECIECKMPIGNIATVFGPTIVGYSSRDPEPLQMINETKHQAIVMDKLLSITPDYWQTFISQESDDLFPGDFNTPQTPDSRAYPQSMLGPVHTPGSYEVKSRTWGKNSFTPMFSNKSRQVSKKPSHFFASPTLN